MESPQAYNQRMYGSADRDAGWDRMDQVPQSIWNQQSGDDMYGESTYGRFGRNNPFNMQQNQMSQIYAPWGGNPYNVGPMMAQQANQAQNNYQQARLYNAPQETARMGMRNQAQGIANQRSNFSDLLSVLPQLLSAFSGGHILGPAAQGFTTNYGASATLGGQPPTGLPGILKQYG